MSLLLPLMATYWPHLVIAVLCYIIYQLSADRLKAAPAAERRPARRQEAADKDDTADMGRKEGGGKAKAKRRLR